MAKGIIEAVIAAKQGNIKTNKTGKRVKIKQGWNISDSKEGEDPSRRTNETALKYAKNREKNDRQIKMLNKQRMLPCESAIARISLWIPGKV